MAVSHQWVSKGGISHQVTNIWGQGLLSDSTFNSTQSAACPVVEELNPDVAWVGSCLFSLSLSLSLGI